MTTSNFTVSQELFCKAITDANNSVGTSISLPVIQNIAISVLDGFIDVKSTDLSTSFSRRLKASTSGNGSIAVPADKISRIVKELPKEDVIAEIDDEMNICVRCGSSRFTISGCSTESFPSINIDEDSVIANIVVDSDELARAIRCTAFVCSDVASRYQMDCIHFDVKYGNIEMAATDSKRVSVYKMNGVCDDDVEVDVNINGDGLKKLLKISNIANKTKVKFTKRCTLFTIGDTDVSIANNASIFPPYQQVLEREPTAEVFVKRADLFSAVKRVAVLANEETNRLSMSIDKGVLTLSGKQAAGFVTEKIPIEQDDVTLSSAYNHKYLTEMLKSMKSDALLIQLTSGEQPAIFLPQNDDELRYKHCIMPMFDS